MPEPSPTYQLLDHLLPGGLHDFVRGLRGRDKSWRVIARTIYEKVGVDVSHEALRRWFPDEENGEAA